MHREADLTARLVDDLDGDAGGFGDAGGGVGGIGERAFNEWELRRDACSNGTAPSRSCTEAGPT